MADVPSPPLCPSQNKKTRKCVAGPLLLPASKKISGKVCRNAAYTSYCVTANSSKIEKTR